MADPVDLAQLTLAMATVAMVIATLFYAMQTRRLVDQMALERKEKYLLARKTELHNVLGRVIAILLWLHEEAPHRKPTDRVRNRLETVEENMPGLEDEELEDCIRKYITSCETNRQLLPMDEDLKGSLEDRRKRLNKELDRELARLTGD